MQIPGLAQRRRLLVLGLALLGGLLLTEAVARWVYAGPVVMAHSQGILYRISFVPGLAFEPRPGAERVTVYPGPDGERRVTYRVNEHGFRGPAFSMVPKAGVLRIACIGDSHTFGTGVMAQDAWPAVMQRELELRLGRAVEVLNCGVSAYDTWREARWLEQRVLAHRPQLVLLQYFCNDTVARDAMGLPAPTTDPWLRWSDPGGGGWMAGLRARSRALDLLLGRVDRSRRLVADNGLNPSAYSAESPGWQRVQRGLDLAQASCAERETVLGAVLFPLLVKRGTGLVSDGALGAAAAECDRRGIARLDGSTLFADHDPQSLRVHPGDPHANALAHGIFGRAVADWLLATQPVRGLGPGDGGPAD